MRYVVTNINKVYDKGVAGVGVSITLNVACKTRD